MGEAQRRETARLVRALLLAIAGLILAPPLGWLVAALVVAVSVARGQHGVLAAVVAAAFVIGWLMPLGGVGAGVLNAMLALVPGLVAGWTIRRDTTYGRLVAVVTATLFAFYAGVLATTSRVIADYAAEMEKLLSGPDGAQYSAQWRALLEVQQWVIEHWNALFVGFAFSSALIWACVLATAAAAWLNRTQTPARIDGAFRTLRPPDWAVWFVIAAALMWLAEQRWPNEPLRQVSWNAAVGLAGLYWMNGLAVAVYAVNALKPNLIMVTLLAFAAMMLNVMPMLVLVGLFDTWGEWRRKIDQLLAARQLRENSRDDAP